MTNQQKQNTVLIALIKEPADFHILEREAWYRIPVKTAPVNIKQGVAKYIAFYISKKITKDLPIIQYYAEIKSISHATRRQLFPHEAYRVRAANKQYYKIQVRRLIALERPILNLCPRRILFIPTTEAKFFFIIRQDVPDFNLLFNRSPLEDTLYTKFLEHNIRTHREYFIQTSSGNYHLDFALFCFDGKINIECDGDTYHDKKEQVHYDKKRNNALEVEGWSVLRYTTEQINKNIDMVVQQVQENTVKYGGYEKLDDFGKFQYAPKLKPGEQGRLFD